MEEDIPPTVTCLRMSLLFIFFLVSVLSLPLILGFAAVFAGSKAISNPIAVPSQCKIVSSGVDLRSSMVCELGLLNYKAKHVFYPFERKKFRCRHDYYWASIFKVEYRDHSGEIQVAFAEAPNEALPLHCRPSFLVAWWTKDKLKVNQTYDCWYTFGIAKVNINHESLFSCHAKDPSRIEMLKRYFILSKSIFENWYMKRRRAWYWKWETIAGLVAGISTSFISISLLRVLQLAKSSLLRSLRMPTRASFSRLRKACLFIAYFSFTSWLAIQYAKRIGLQEILYIR